MRQQPRGTRLACGIWALLAATTLAGPCQRVSAQSTEALESPSNQKPTSEQLSLANGWTDLQELLHLPPWMQLELSVTAEPLFNPLGGERSAGSWIQQGTLSLELSSGLNRPSASWKELDHWQLNGTLNHDAGDAYYSSAIGALFPLQQAAYPPGFYLSEVSIERARGDGWLNLKAGILPINPDFVEVPVLGNYVHSAFNNTLNITVVDLPINPYAALGAVVSAHPSPELSLRYGLFDLSSTAPLSRWLGLNEVAVGPDSGTAQFLQLDFGPRAMLSQPLEACRTAEGGVRRHKAGASCSAPVSVQNQLPNGLLSMGGFLTSENGNGVYGSLSVPSGLPLGLDHRVWIGGSYSPDSDEDISPTFVGGGLVIQGALSSRPLDLVVIAIGRGGLSNQLSSSAYEGVLELGYRMQFNENMDLQPTLQWIFNPSGAAGPVPGILAAGIHISVSF